MDGWLKEYREKLAEAGGVADRSAHDMSAPQRAAPCYMDDYHQASRLSVSCSAARFSSTLTKHSN